MNNSEILNSIRNGLIVSCQALSNEPLHSSYIMSRMAFSAKEGGAVGIRANSIEDITEIKKVCELPVIGIIKKDYDDSPCYITATMDEIDQLVAAGVEIIAIDATKRIHPYGKTIDVLFKEARAKYPAQLFMADCSDYEEGMHAAELGFDLVGTTMHGYTDYTKGAVLPDLELIRSLVNDCGKPVIAEGGIWSPDQLLLALEAGAHAAVVGTAITRTRELTRKYVNKIKPMTSNLEFVNSGKHSGDNDGPAYVIYSKTGYNKGTMDVALGSVRTNMKRNDDGRYTNAYIFLGADLYDGNKVFKNCMDAGLCLNGGRGGWHLFLNCLRQDDGNFLWYESEKDLNSEHEYKLELDLSNEDRLATIRIYDIDEGCTLADEYSCVFPYSKKDGSYTAIYQDFALDYPDDMKYDINGNPSENDWEGITLYNTDKGIYMKNIIISNATLYNAGGSYIWTADRTDDRFMWPSKGMRVDYPCTRIREIGHDNMLVLDLDMNR